MSSTGKKLLYLYRCSEGAESFSVTLTRSGRAEVRQENWVFGLRNAISYKENAPRSRNLFGRAVDSTHSLLKTGSVPPTNLMFQTHKVRYKGLFCMAAAMCLD